MTDVSPSIEFQFFFFFLAELGFELRAFVLPKQVLAKQELYSLSYTSSPF
jgi:hypothetical protein